MYVHVYAYYVCVCIMYVHCICIMYYHGVIVCTCTIRFVIAFPQFVLRFYNDRNMFHQLVTYTEPLESKTTLCILSGIPLSCMHCAHFQDGQEVPDGVP